MGKIKQEVGNRYSRLLVLKVDHISKDSRCMWLCKCDCGTTKVISGKHLRSGAIRSCGCLSKDRFKDMITKHGLRYHPIYLRYHGMLKRCYNPKEVQYKNYGGRGITVCDRWKNSFENFYEDMIEDFRINLEIDRINNDLGYNKENCRWVTKANNTRNRGSNLNCTSKYKGVYWSNKDNMWIAKIGCGGKTYELGKFNSEEKAATVYNEKALETFKEFAYLNKILEILD